MSYKVAVIFSGGLDSTVLLYDVHQTFSGNVRASSVNYGQRHRRELVAARLIADELGVEHRVIDLAALGRLVPGSSQTDSRVKVPHGHYEEESMKVTVVPNRNMMLLSTSAMVAIANGAKSLAYAAHAGDHAIYPDCRPEFVEAMRRALALADWNPLELMAPYLFDSKADIVRRGVLLAVPFGATWSCYEGVELHCGQCGTCVERQEAFAIAGASDPTRYSTHDPLGNLAP
jgi:7-cyano-7-deazaguanine synthase